MKRIYIKLLNQEGDELETLPLEQFSVAEEPSASQGSDNLAILEGIKSLWEEVLRVLQERRAEPLLGPSSLKIAIGRALLNADTIEGDLTIEVAVKPQEEQGHGSWPDFREGSAGV